MTIFDLGRRAQAAASRLIVKSALNPNLWMCGIVSMPCLALAVFVREDRPLMWALYGLALTPVLVACSISVGFAIFKPEKLQSEDYQLRTQSLQMLQGRDGPEIIEAVAVIANPALPEPPALLSSGDSQ